MLAASMCEYEKFRVVVKPLTTCLACLAVPALGCWMQTGRSHAGHTNYTTIILEFVYTADQAPGRRRRRAITKVIY